MMPEHGQKKVCTKHVWKSKLTPASINVAFLPPHAIDKREDIHCASLVCREAV